MRNESRYIQYARARSLAPGAARAVVDSVLRALVDDWPRIIMSDRPASEAWRILTMRVAAARNSPPFRDDRGTDAVHRALEGQEADVFLLRYRMSLSLEETADLMGLEVPAVTVALRKGMSDLLDPQ
ncbi:sigma factor-like helix-turn-helix DNA-binding protein [Streptomyces microflavus]|uniref:sigma factor-like helix-turn-helix DNA-binding protein n=1 Tax=Streptomyces microflavus TaxID=1919 RepID=UPI00339CADB8